VPKRLRTEGGMKAHFAIALGYFETVREYFGDRETIGIDVDEKSY
jgi:hypothetical protein